MAGTEEKNIEDEGAEAPYPLQGDCSDSCALPPVRRTDSAAPRPAPAAGTYRRRQVIEPAE